MAERLFRLPDITKKDEVIAAYAVIGLQRYDSLVIPVANPEELPKAMEPLDRIDLFESSLEKSNITPVEELALIDNLPVAWNYDAKEMEVHRRRLTYTNLFHEDKPRIHSTFQYQTIYFSRPLPLLEPDPDYETVKKRRKAKFFREAEKLPTGDGDTYLPLRLFDHAIVVRGEMDGPVIVRIPMLDDKGNAISTGNITMTNKELIFLQQLCLVQKALEMPDQK